jgi:sporulation protein YlmC with PRC-barrel domain
MTVENIRQRSELLGTQVITRDKGKRLGVVNQIWVDIDHREVVAIGLKDGILGVAGIPKYMYLAKVKEIGDVILVENEDVIEDDIDVEAYSTLINSEVITETGDLLGKVRGFRFNTDNGNLVSIIIASIGLPQIPEQLLSTYELSIEEVVSSGPNRLIVFEGSEERLQQLSMGVLERLGLGEAPWSRGDDLYYTPTIKPTNQLPKGQTVPAEPMRSVATPVVEDDYEEWEEPISQVPPSKRQQVARVYQDEYDDQPVASPPPKRQPVYKDDYDEGENWNDGEYDDDYDPREYRSTPKVEEKEPEPVVAEENDNWGEDDDGPQPGYKAPKVNIPQKTKAPEYQPEEEY